MAGGGASGDDKLMNSESVEIYEGICEENQNEEDYSGRYGR